MLEVSKSLDTFVPKQVLKGKNARSRTGASGDFAFNEDLKLNSSHLKFILGLKTTQKQFSHELTNIQQKYRVNKT